MDAQAKIVEEENRREYSFLGIYPCRDWPVYEFYSVFVNFIKLTIIITGNCWIAYQVRNHGLDITLNC